MACHVFVVSVILVSAVPQVRPLVPPKTPVLSGFEPAAIGSYRELVCDASQPGAGTINYKWYRYYPRDAYGNTWESKSPIGTSQKYTFNPVTEKHLFYQGGYNESVSGQYLCRASNSAATRDSEWGGLYVYTPCSLYSVSIFPSNPALGRTFTLNCYIPDPSGFHVFWTRRKESSSTVEAIAGSNSCFVSHAVRSRYNWSPCSPQNFTSKTKTFNLQVTNAQPSDSGYWVCEDINLSCSSNPVNVVIQALPGKPHIVGFSSGPVTAGIQMNLKCIAKPPGDTYDWYKDGAKLTTSSSFDFKVTKESAGDYKCVAENSAGFSNSSDKTLVVYYKPDSVVVSSGKNSSRYVGEKDRFTCTVTGGYPTPTLKIFFKRPGGTPVEVTQGQDRVMTKEDNLVEYYCEAKVSGYPALDMTSSRKTYNVMFPLTVRLSSSPTTVKEGDAVTLTCEASGGSPAVYTFGWYHKGTQIPNMTSRKYRITSIQCTEAGDYHCRAVKYSPDGIANATLKIDVLYKAKWDPEQPKIFAVASKPAGPVRLTLHVIANPRPTDVTWYHPNHKIATAENFLPAEVNGTYTLSKGSIGSLDYGKYVVKVSNSVGISYFVFELLRQAAPGVPRYTITRKGQQVTVVLVSAPLKEHYTLLELKFCEPVQTPITTGCDGFFVHIRDPAKTNYTFHLTHETTKYTFYLDFHDKDGVYRSGPVHPEPAGQAKPVESSPDGGMIAGVVVFVILLVAVVVAVVIVLHRRNMACFAGRNKPEGSNLDDERTGTTQPESVSHDLFYMNVENRAFEGDTTQQEPFYANDPRHEPKKDSDENPYDKVGNQYADLKITADVIASQTYAELK